MSDYMKEYKRFRRLGNNKEMSKLFADWMTHGVVQF